LDFLCSVEVLGGDEVFHFSNSLESVQPWHHEVGENMADPMAGLNKLGKLHNCFLAVENELALVI
jgi:hypothetical protein